MSKIDSRIVLDRRSLLKGGLLMGAAGLLGACAKSTGRVAKTAATTLPAPIPTPVGHYPFRVGGIQGFVLSDGALPLGAPTPDIVPNADPAEAARFLEESFLPSNALRAELNTVLFQAGGRNVLVDCGYGPGALAAGQGRQDAALAAVGLKPADIDVVFITHAHPDHLNGFSTPAGAARFPNAEMVIHENDYNFWGNPANEVAAFAQLFADARARFAVAGDRLRTIKAGEAIVPGLVAEAAHGHTPGHCIVRVESEGQQLVVTADTANHHILFMRRTDWAFAYDADKPAAAATRARVLDMLAADKLRFLAYHFPFPGIGRVRRSGASAFDFVPEPWGTG